MFQIDLCYVIDSKINYWYMHDYYNNATQVTQISPFVFFSVHAGLPLAMEGPKQEPPWTHVHTLYTCSKASNPSWILEFFYRYYLSSLSPVITSGLCQGLGSKLFFVNIIGTDHWSGRLGHHQHREHNDEKEMVHAWWCPTLKTEGALTRSLQYTGSEAI